MEHLPVVLNGVKLGAQHFDKVKDPMQAKIDKARGRVPQEDPDVKDHRTMEEKGYVLRKRCEVQSDEEIVEVVRHKGQVLPRRPRRPGAVRTTSSMDDMRQGRSSRYRRDAGGYGSDSEGSVPPRGRRTRSSNNSRKGGNSSSSSSSSSDLGSTSGSERDIKKMRRKKWITAAFASVATIHAVSKVYSSVESHDKRIEEVQQGTLSPEEAHKKARSARWQDAAAIGIAALGIKGAISEWNEVQEEHFSHKQKMEESKEHHKRRLEHQRRMRAKQQGGYYKGRDGDWYYDGPVQQSSERYRSGPRSTNAANDYNAGRGALPYEDRKMIEGPPSRGTYDDDYYNDYGRSRTRNGRYQSGSQRDYSPAGRSRARSLQKSKTWSASNDNDNDSDVKAYRRQIEDKGEIKDFGFDAMEEVFEKIGDA